jgi:uncharacterized protein (TIGR02118 family)
MIRMTVMYPNAEDAVFDMDYYLSTHIPLVQERCGDALTSCSVEQGLGGGAPGSAPPFLVIARLCVDSMEDFQTHVAPHDPEFAADIPNFTNIKPIVQINEVIM